MSATPDTSSLAGCCPVDSPCTACLRQQIAEVEAAPSESDRVAVLQWYAKLLRSRLARAPAKAVNGEAMRVTAYRRALPGILVHLEELGVV